MVCYLYFLTSAPAPWSYISIFTSAPWSVICIFYQCIIIFYYYVWPLYHGLLFSFFTSALWSSIFLFYQCTMVFYFHILISAPMVLYFKRCLQQQSQQDKFRKWQPWKHKFLSCLNLEFLCLQNCQSISYWEQDIIIYQLLHCCKICVVYSQTLKTESGSGSSLYKTCICHISLHICMLFNLVSSRSDQGFECMKKSSAPHG